MNVCSPSPSRKSPASWSTAGCTGAVRADRTQLFVAAVIGIITGIFVNWITGPLLHW
jgi:hypothetical protein